MNTIIALSGDHDDDEDTRLAALSELTVDVKIDSWIHNALQLERYPDAKTEGWTEVPKTLISVALGRAMIAVGGGDEPVDWGFTSSAPSTVLLNHIAVNAKDKGFDVEDDGDVKQFATMWHLRRALGIFARDNADYNGDDNSFVVAHDEDRYNATHENFIAPFIMFNTMKLGDIALESHLCAWSLSEWLFQFMMTEYDKDDGGDFNVVGRTLLAAAKATFPHLACSSEAATVAAFFDLGEQLPPDMLSNHFDKGTRLKWIANVARWSTPANRGAMLEEHFGKVLNHHPELAKWTGAAPDAYSHFCTLLRLLMPGAKPTFDVVT